MRKLEKAVDTEGKIIYVDTSMVLTSNPPKYNYYLDEDGTQFGGYIFCHKVEFL